MKSTPKEVFRLDKTGNFCQLAGMSTSPFVERFSNALGPGRRDILDLGSGSHVAQTLEMAALGHNVHAVDRDECAKPINGFSYEVADIVAWSSKARATRRFDGVLSRLVIQFMTPEDLTTVVFPAMRDMIEPGGVLAIRTFYKQPEPKMPKPHPSYWTPATLAVHFPEWETLYENMFEHDDVAIQTGEMMHWFETDYFARKPA